MAPQTYSGEVTRLPKQLIMHFAEPTQASSALRRFGRGQSLPMKRLQWKVPERPEDFTRVDILGL
jgi:hypothetical protein